MNYEFGKRILITGDMANNHGKSLDRALKICDDFKKLKDEFGDVFDFSLKTQYRQLSTFIHKDYKNNFDYKYVKRFTETELTSEEFKIIQDINKQNGLITMTTPFCEDSVDLAIEHNVDIIKVASCSSNDYPLINKIVNVDKPIIISTAGLSFLDLDKIVSFFEHRDKNFCLLSCVASYPCEKENMNLNQIDVLKKRYQNITIGFSTHEAMTEFDSVDIAYAKGAKIFEFHFGLTGYLNQYSKDYESARIWLNKLKDAVTKCGVENERYKPSDKELNDLSCLKRGVWVKEDIKVGDKITRDMVYYAIPMLNNSLVANDMSKYAEIICNKEIKKDDPVIKTDITYTDKREMAYKIIKEAKEILKLSGVHIPNKVEIHISHHKGISDFYNYGSVILDVINREYCKKLIVVFPNQVHCEHYHKIKEEAFSVIYGDLILNNKEYKKGDIVVVERCERHSFTSKTGCVFEEISTSHIVGDSYYTDETIMNNKFRKTEMTLRDI